MKSNRGYLASLKKLCILTCFATFHAYASLQATSIPTFNLDLFNYDQPYSEIISFCVYNTEPDGNLNYRVNLCTQKQVNGLFAASSMSNEPIKFQLFWKDKNSAFEELSPCALNAKVFMASNQFNCGGRENVQLKLVIEPSWAQEAEAGLQRIPLSIALHPA